MKYLNELQKVKENWIHFIPRLLIVVIVGQTLPFKYLGAEESIWIFTQLNMEPYGRVLVGILESVAIVFLLTRFYWIGAYMSLAIVGSASLLHIVSLGIEIANDGGLLFILSIIVSLSSLWLVVYWNFFRKKSGITLRLNKRKIEFDTMRVSE